MALNKGLNLQWKRLIYHSYSSKFSHYNKAQILSRWKKSRLVLIGAFGLGTAATILALESRHFRKATTLDGVYDKNIDIGMFWNQTATSLVSLVEKVMIEIASFHNVGKVYARELQDINVQSEKTASLQTQREMRYYAFASVEYDGVVYMTPQDFLESLTDDVPRPHIGRVHLSQSQVEKYLSNTQNKRKGSSKFFRNLGDKGLISYSEYIFLLCALTKPHFGFRIAFNMFDKDGNERVDKDEFLMLQNLMPSSSHSDEDPSLNRSGTLLKDTTLTVHLFGRKGTDTLSYEDFHKFIENLQTEVLEMEFNEFSHGLQTIEEEDFARILLRYTILPTEEKAEYLQRLHQRFPHSKGINFQDFKEFCQFLNNLDDFNLALKIYSMSNRSVSETEFRRAVKACTGSLLNSHMVHVVFQLFDIDGDGKLSQAEFISVMKDRLHRGARVGSQTWWESYRACVGNEMRNL